MEELNDAQRKLYIILKRLSKHIIKDVCDKITSYILKNIVLWIAELNPSEYFTNEVLTERLLQTLVVLKQCVHMEYLPSYMIPERNLLLGKMSSEQKVNVIECLNNCIEQGDELIKNLNWPKLKSSLSKSVQELKGYEQYRESVELFAMCVFGAYVRDAKPISGQNALYRKGILLRMLELISSPTFDAYIPIATS